MNNPRIDIPEILQPASSNNTIQAVTLAASPMTYMAREPGALSIQGGTVSLVSLARGAASIALGLTAGLIPLTTGDRVTLTYVTAPVLNFIPR